VKIYTRTGDRGETGLLGEERVSKASARIEAYGTVDELNAALGVVAAGLEDDPETGEILERVQNDLHVVCADLASPRLDEGKIPRIQAEHVEALEALCDRLEEELPPLARFVLPGGTRAAAELHWARTVCRRAERRVVSLLEAERERVNPEVVRYLNRLSDLLFLLARRANRRAGAGEKHPDYSPTGKRSETQGSEES